MRVKLAASFTINRSEGIKYWKTGPSLEYQERNPIRPLSPAIKHPANLPTSRIGKGLGGPQNRMDAVKKKETAYTSREGAGIA
jgi:hypothetical protein